MKKCILSLVLAVFALFSNAQDPLFTQKTGNINHFNPALVGAQSDFGVQLNYSNQWPKSSIDIQTYTMLANYRFAGSWGVALEAFADRSAITRYNHLKTNLNYNHTFGDIAFRYGTNLGAAQYNIDLNSLTYEDQIDPSQGFVNPNAEPLETNPSYYMLFDLGASAYYKGFMLGVSGMQLNRPRYNVQGANVRLKPRYVGTLGYLKEFDKVALAGLATFQQINETQILETQVFTQYKFAKLGIGYRQIYGTLSNFDYFSISAGVQLEKFSVGYSYDDNPLNSSRIKTGGTHQATAAWYIKGLSKEKGMSKLMNVMM